MTVGELIEKLNQFPKDHLVYSGGTEYFRELEIIEETRVPKIENGKEAGEWLNVVSV